MILPLVFPFSVHQTIKKIGLLLGSTLIFFLLLSFFYWLSPYIDTPLSGSFLPFSQDNIAFFVATLFVAQFLIFYALHHLHEQVPLTLIVVLVIITGCIWFFIFPLNEKPVFRFFSIVILTSFFVDLLVASQVMYRSSRNNILTHTFFVILNSVVVILVSGALFYDITPLLQSTLLIVAVLAAYGMLPFLSSFWRYVTFQTVHTSAMFFICLQTLLVVHILQQVVFSAVPDLLLISLLLLTVFFTFRPNTKRQAHRPVKAIFACQITATIAICSFFPSASLHAQISLIFSMLLFMLLFQIKTLSDNRFTFILYSSFLFFASTSYLVVVVFHQTDLSVEVPHFASFQSVITYSTQPIILFFLVTGMALYNVYQVMFFMRKKKSTQSFIETTHPYLIASSVLSVIVHHLIFMFIS